MPSALSAERTERQGRTSTRKSSGSLPKITGTNTTTVTRKRSRSNKKSDSSKMLVLPPASAAYWGIKPIGKTTTTPKALDSAPKATTGPKKVSAVRPKVHPAQTLVTTKMPSVTAPKVTRSIASKGKVTSTPVTQPKVTTKMPCVTAPKVTRSTASKGKVTTTPVRTNVTLPSVKRDAIPAKRGAKIDIVRVSRPREAKKADSKPAARNASMARRRESIHQDNVPGTKCKQEDRVTSRPATPAHKPSVTIGQVSRVRSPGGQKGRRVLTPPRRLPSQFVHPITRPLSTIQSVSPSTISTSRSPSVVSVLPTIHLKAAKSDSQAIRRSPVCSNQHIRSETAMQLTTTRQSVGSKQSRASSSKLRVNLSQLSPKDAGERTNNSFPVKTKPSMTRGPVKLVNLRHRRKLDTDPLQRNSGQMEIPMAHYLTINIEDESTVKIPRPGAARRRPAQGQYRDTYSPSSGSSNREAISSLAGSLWDNTSPASIASTVSTEVSSGMAGYTPIQSSSRSSSHASSVSADTSTVVFNGEVYNPASSFVIPWISLFSY